MSETIVIGGMTGQTGGLPRYTIGRYLSLPKVYYQNAKLVIFLLSKGLRINI